MAEESTTPGAAAIDPAVLKAHPRDLHMDAAGNELWDLVQAWRDKWKPTRVEYLWVISQMNATELRAYGREERDKLDGGGT